MSSNIYRTPGDVTTSRTKTLAERIEEAKLARAAAESAITEADKEEISDRETLAQEEEAKRAALKIKRGLDLARREEAAREALGPNVPISAMSADIAGCTHTMIVMHSGYKAFEAWERGVAASLMGGKSASGNKVSRTEVTREFAMASIYDWNGMTDLRGPASEHGPELLKLMKGFPGLATSVSNVASKLAGYALEERKSGD